MRLFSTFLNNQSVRDSDEDRELILYRRLLALAGAVYLIWWFAVRALFQDAFNPFLSRLGVVICCWGGLGLTFYFSFFRRHIRIVLYFCTWLITFHYYYLLYMNAADMNWIIGTFITVMAITLLTLSSFALLAYSFFVLALTGALTLFNPQLVHSVFLPGIFTILVQAYIGLYTRLSALKNLRESNARFRLLFNSTFEGVLVHENQKIINVNEAVMKMFGYTKEQMLGSHLLQYIYPEDQELAREKIGAANLTPLEIRGVTQYGETLFIEVRGKDFNDHGKIARLVTIQDITDRKKAQQERIAALTLAENVRVRDDFISIASHELKTPLSALKLQVQMIDQDMKEGLPAPEMLASVNEALDLVKRQISRLNELVETMLDVSRISTGRFTLNLQKIEITEMVSHLIKSLPEPVMAQSHASVIHFHAPEKIWIEADQHRFEQVVENIITNAQKYGDAKPIEVQLRKEGTRAFFIVKDHGIGIAPDFVSRVFERFERAISGRHITGFGLGLYIVKQIVEAHHWSVSVKSQLGKGSVFTVEFPVLRN